MSDRPAFSLDAKYTQIEGTILLSGVQALVRLPLDQRRADQRRGLNTAGLISGYRGSPLAGLDLLIQRSQPILDEHHIRFIPGVNEDLGATMIFGSQIANLFPQPRYDGVIGMWYGKAPGVDRSGDIFKHANVAGTGRYGGVLAVAGDDPMAKSSTLPSASETAMYDALMPVLVPGNIQDVLDYGRLGFELSRFAGLWVGFKLSNTVAEQFGTALVSPDRLDIVNPPLTINGRPWQPTQTHTLGAPTSLALEQEIHTGRLVAAVAFAAANRLNRITVAAPGARIGIVAAGKPYYELRQALAGLGLDDDALERYGVRMLKLGMIFPLDQEIIRTFAHGLEEIIVVEEKRAFLELFIRDALYHQPERPRVIGKHDHEGRPFLPAHGELDAEAIAPLLAQRLDRSISGERFAERLTLLRAQRDLPVMALSAGPGLARTAYFCSGCPHNRSTTVPAGSLAGGGIGCHGLVLGMDRNTIGLGHMGGEGAQWVGAAPFSETGHMFQNLGDGTLFHSGSLAIRQAVAAGTHITFKILYNGAVGMTGGQEVDGAMSAPALTRALEAEGVQHIIVTSDHIDRYPPDTRWAPGVKVWHRDRLDEAQVALRETPGVTALIHDQMCAAELRRLRKRGRMPDPSMRIMINQAVCEGCGDCGVKSNCLSVQPVETEFGRKTQIHQSSCNKDYSCLLGDCPAFITVEPEAVKPVHRRLEVNEPLPDPIMRGGPDCAIVMTGIGGTGVVTVNQILATAALLDGKHVDGLDQTGLSQKGGAVVSHLKLSTAPPTGSNRIAAGAADCLLAFDLLTATAPQNIARASAERTIAVASTSQVPTGAMVASVAARFPPIDGLIASINSHTRAADNFFLDAIALAETAFGDHLAANMIVVGAAYQRGLIPIDAGMIEQAIALNGVAVQMNTHAFRLGRRVVIAPGTAAEPAPNDFRATAPRVSAAARNLIESVGAPAGSELRRLLEIRVPELIAYQNVNYAGQYVAFVERVRLAEETATPGKTQIGEAVARYLFKLMAYKDEYEVARLFTSAGFSREVVEQFGAGARIKYQLHPPFLRALGWQKKIALGRWLDHAFRVLVRMRGLRGTPLDLFGYAEVRRVERALIDEYRAMIERALSHLTPENYTHTVELAQLPDGIRGYEEIKLGNVKRFRTQAEGLLQAINAT
jgi:indolepyruvate ferredoxin oxidoreductase